MAGRRRPDPPQTVQPATVLAGYYCRVSTVAQIDGTSLGTQVSTCRGDIGRRGWEVVEGYVDGGQSGAKASRPELDRMLDDARRGRINALVVARLDRLGRSLAHLLTLIEKLRSLGVRVIFVSEGLDSDRTAMWDLLVGILGSIAAWERELIRSRVMSGLYARVADGGFVGSAPPFGYRVAPDPRGRGVVLVVDPAEAASIHAIYDTLVVRGTGPSKAAAELNAAGHRADDGRPWTPGALSTWARRSGPLTAGGTWVWGGVEVPVEPILTAEQLTVWQAWIEAIGEQQAPRGPYLLSGRVTMPCGKQAMGRTAGDRAPTYTCSGRSRSRNPNPCSCHAVRVDVLDAGVWAAVTGVLNSPGVIDSITSRLHGQEPGGEISGAVVAEAAERVNRAREVLADAYREAVEAGDSPATARAMNQVHADAVRVAEADLFRLQRARAAGRRTATTGSDTQDLAQRIRSAMDNPDLDARQEVLVLVDARVVITGWQECSTCAGKGCLPLPPGSGRRWPPVCPDCRRMRCLPIVEVHTDLLERFAPAATGQSALTA